MKYLLDTSILVPLLFESRKLPQDVKNIILNTDNDIYVSLVSLWEMKIKHTLGKLPYPQTLYDDLKSAGYSFIVMTENHIEIYGTLPLHHRDPFDRMLIAQSKALQSIFLTTDKILTQYDVNIETY